MTGHDRPVPNRADDRPGDEVGEGELDAAVREGFVQGPPTGVELVDRDRPEGGGSRDLQAFVHRPGEHPGCAAKRCRLPGRAGSVPAGNQVGLRHLATGAGSVDRRQVDALCFGDPPGDRGRPVAVAIAGRGGASIGPGTHLRGSRLGTVPRSSVVWRGRCGSSRLHFGEDCAYRHVLIRLHREPGHRAGGRRRDLGVDFVGRDLDQRLSLLDEIADGDMPLEDRSLGHRFAHLGHRHLESRRFSHRT